MKKLTRTIAAVSALAMSDGALSASGGSTVNADKGHVYYLCMKVEQQDRKVHQEDRYPVRYRHCIIRHLRTVA